MENRNTKSAAVVADETSRIDHLGGDGNINNDMDHMEDPVNEWRQQRSAPTGKDPEIFKKASPPPPATAGTSHKTGNATARLGRKDGAMVDQKFSSLLTLVREQSTRGAFHNAALADVKEVDQEEDPGRTTLLEQKHVGPSARRRHKDEDIHGTQQRQTKDRYNDSTELLSLERGTVKQQRQMLSPGPSANAETSSPDMVHNEGPKFPQVGANPLGDAYSNSMKQLGAGGNKEVGGGHHQNGYTSSRNVVGSGGHHKPGGDPFTSSSPSTKDLAVANPGGDPVLLDLPTTEEELGDQARGRGKLQLNRVTLIALCCGVIAVVVVVVGIAQFAMQLSDNNNNGNDGESVDMNNASNNSSSSPQPGTLEFQLLSLLPGDTQRDIQNGGSPQAIAFEWIVQDPHFTSYPGWRQVQRFALAVLYHATNGSRWRHNAHWLDYSVHECDWYTEPSFGHADFFSTTPPYNDQYIPQYPTSDAFPCMSSSNNNNDTKILHVNSSGSTETVQHLWLDFNNLEGTLPPELFLLTNIKSLSLGLNPLVGTLSKEIGNFPILEALAIFNSGISGSLPNELGRLTKLQSLALHENHLAGPIPDLKKLSQLRLFLANGNFGLTGTIPTEWGRLTELVQVFLHDNLLSGKWPNPDRRLLPLDS